MAPCVSCARPAPDATICSSCTEQAATDLRAIPWLTQQLTVTLTRQTRLSDRNGPRGSETPVVFDHRASVDLETFSTDLARWATAIGDHRGVRVDADQTPVSLARWLLRWNGAAAQHPEAGDYIDELSAMVHAARRTIDKPPERRYVGPCDECGTDIFVGIRAPAAICECGATYPIEERRIWLFEQAVDQLRTAAQLARELPWIAGITIDRKRINQWSTRGRITVYLPHPDDPRAPRFRVGEVIDLARASVSTTASGAA